MTEAQKQQPALFTALDLFVDRHIGPTADDIKEMLAEVGADTLEHLVDRVVPDSIRDRMALQLGQERGEREIIDELRTMAERNLVYRSLIGMGYYNCITPPIIQRNILENPGWYTQYTPYQAEISQGRLEALINFQTMIRDLTGLPLSNASLLDEGTAAAEAMTMCFAIARKKKRGFVVSAHCHPQIIAVVETRAQPLGIEIHKADDLNTFDFEGKDIAGILIQYPDTNGKIVDPSRAIERAHKADALVVMAADPLALTLLRPPGEWGADIAIGSTQRFGIPLGYGGPHAAYLACRDEYRRHLPGRLIGVSLDVHGKTGYRLSLQTREQHIRRDRATSNICTSQVLLGIMASMYAVYHGADGLRKIAQRIHNLTSLLQTGLQDLGYKITEAPIFDTLRIHLEPQVSSKIIDAALQKHINLRQYDNGDIGISLDETCGRQEIADLFEIFDLGQNMPFDLNQLASAQNAEYNSTFARTSKYLTHEVFQLYQSEHELLRYIFRLQSRDISLVNSMIPLGSCTMKLNGTSEMLPVSWPHFNAIHPFAPSSQVIGYRELFKQLSDDLAEITGLPAISLQPNAGSQGEYAGLLVIRAYHHSRGDTERDICLIPTSAHGTNPASAVMAGFKVVTVNCDLQGDIDLADLELKAKQHANKLGAIMITYPSTHGVFEEGIQKICDIVHKYGGQVYLDGANMNALVGICRPGKFGADVCHLNLHKTFSIPHGGGGPGMGPIAAAPHLAAFMPGHPIVDLEYTNPIGPISAAPYGSASILPISWTYIKLMGTYGLTRATQVAILNANYMARRLSAHYNILYTGSNCGVAHEFILDLRPFKASASIEAVDVAKRLMDFGFHSPTMSWPVAGTLMIEPTESESKAELDRFCDAMIAIRKEIQDIIDGHSDPQNNPLKNAPHPLHIITANEWHYPYSREQAAFPVLWTRLHKFWPAVGRIDDAYGDRNLFCSCPPVS
jgi:glycine dehydrogenase